MELFSVVSWGQNYPHDNTKSLSFPLCWHLPWWCKSSAGVGRYDPMGTQVQIRAAAWNCTGPHCTFSITYSLRCKKPVSSKHALDVTVITINFIISQPLSTRHCNIPFDQMESTYKVHTLPNTEWCFSSQEKHLSGWDWAVSWTGHLCVAMKQHPTGEDDCQTMIILEAEFFSFIEV